MKNLKNSILAILLTLFCSFTVDTILAQQTGQKQSANESQNTKTQSEKEKKQELRTKACGTESVNYTARTDKTQHPTPDAPADKAMIYVMRTTMLGYKIHSKLAVDGEWMGVNRGKTYFFFTIESGEHYFCSEAENQSYLTLTVEAGKTYYLQQQVKPGIFKARTELVIMSEEQGKKKLAEVNLSVFEQKR